ncbi:MAG: RdgB/HAM1 family non-canonical purine NTP pyrophosphatase [Acidobacteriota bacterium]|nr:RdgB/HAM1 family non-canonical purine NTP pyrophosphatase [Acidobacteriota bacterium]
MSRPTLLLATTNPGKLREIRDILGVLPWTLVTLADYASVPEPEETGATFADNARLKARYYATHIGLLAGTRLAVAEDSGLEIDALGGEPGVRSARFNGESYAEKFATIGRMLADQGVATSSARFVCALTLARGDDIFWETSGSVEGQIQLPPRGDHGFGYDPIFYYPAYGRTLGEVTPQKKAAVSHRGQAFLALRSYLTTLRVAETTDRD